MQIKNYFKNTLVFLLLLLTFSIIGDTVLAQGSNDVLWDGLQNDIQASTGLGNDDPRNIAALIINIVLGFLGILALVLIIIAGFRWMTAGGNDEQVTSSRKLLINAVIGLIIILSAYALAAFVLDAVYRASTSGS